MEFYPFPAHEVIVSRIGEKQICRDLFTKGVSIREIATYLNIPERTAYQWTTGLKIPSRKCAHCQATFQPSRRNHDFCSRYCKNNNAYKRKHKRASPRHCPQCGVPIAEDSNSSKVFCSPRCRSRYHYQQSRIKIGKPAVEKRVKQTEQQKRDQIVPTVLEADNPLTARAILEQVGLADTVGHRRYLIRKLNEHPDIQLVDKNRNRRYKRKHTQASFLTTPDRPAALRDLADRLSQTQNQRVRLEISTLEALLQQPPNLIPGVIAEAKACFGAVDGSCIVTASYFLPVDDETLIPRVIDALRDKNRAPLWVWGGDLVFVADQRCPERIAYSVRRIMHQIAESESIRLRRGTAWGRNDWKFDRDRYKHHLPPKRWDMRWWTG